MLEDATHTAVANIPRNEKWVTGTGFGSPVVPDVKATKITSSGRQVTESSMSEDFLLEKDIIAGIDSGSSV